MDEKWYTVTAFVAGMVPFFIGILALSFKKENLKQGLLFFCISFIVGCIVYVRWVDLPKISSMNSMFSPENLCPYIINNQPSEILKPAYRELVRRCQREKSKRIDAVLIVPREQIMTIWCELLSEAEEVFATNLAGPMDWEQFKGSRDPCALECQTTAKIKRVFICDEFTKDHYDFSIACATSQDALSNISTKVLPLSVAQKGPPQDVVRALECAGGYDIVVIKKSGQKVAMLTDIDTAQNRRIAIRSYLYENDKRVNDLENVFWKLWNAATPISDFKSKINSSVQ